jgi:hypothetical protein
MYPEGMIVQVIGNTNNHWFEIGELVTVTEPNSCGFRGRAVNGNERVTSNGTLRYHIGGGAQVKWREVIPAQSLEELLKECLE